MSFNLIVALLNTVTCVLGIRWGIWWPIIALNAVSALGNLACFVVSAEVFSK